jgi:uncharacterized repeat protein (TIGR03803 family)
MGGFGTVFEIAKTATGYANTPTTLVNFNGTNGANPFASLIFDANGNLFGTTRLGGANNFGTVFEIAKTTGGYASTPNTLINFCSLPNCADGGEPFASLIFDNNGNLFGTTRYGGANNGTVFEIVKTAGGYASTPTILISFNGNGGEPYASLIFDANGNLYGTTEGGGTGGGGTVFEIAKTTGGYASTPTTLVNFCSLPNCADGELPDASLIADANGNLFGTTSMGGTGTYQTSFPTGGTVFEIAKTTGGYASTPTTLVNFCSLPNCADGELPVASLIADAKGNLFGTASAGGRQGGGVVFEITGSGFIPPKQFVGAPGKAFRRGLPGIPRVINKRTSEVTGRPNRSKSFLGRPPADVAASYRKMFDLKVRNVFDLKVGV